MAVKRPRPEFFRTDAQRADFEREAETWAGLGLHPHVVTCHYVRRIDGVPCVFAEFAPGGSLADRLRDGPLPYGRGDRRRDPGRVGARPRPRPRARPPGRQAGEPARLRNAECGMRNRTRSPVRIRTPHSGSHQGHRLRAGAARAAVESGSRVPVAGRRPGSPGPASSPPSTPPRSSSPASTLTRRADVWALGRHPARTAHRPAPGGRPRRPGPARGRRPRRLAGGVVRLLRDCLASDPRPPAGHAGGRGSAARQLSQPDRDGVPAAWPPRAARLDLDAKNNRGGVARRPGQAGRGGGRCGRRCCAPSATTRRPATTSASPAGGPAGRRSTRWSPT